MLYMDTELTRLVMVMLTIAVVVGLVKFVFTMNGDTRWWEVFTPRFWSDDYYSDQVQSKSVDKD